MKMIVPKINIGKKTAPETPLNPKDEKILSSGKPIEQIETTLDMTSPNHPSTSSPEALSTSSHEPVSYFDEWDTPEAPPAPQTAPAVTSAGAKLTREEFIKMYCGGFSMASALTGLKSLQCDSGEERCIEGFGALYDTADEVPMLHFMLQPSGKWLGRCMAMGMLFAPMAAGVAAEVAEKKKPKADFTAAKNAPKSNGAGGEYEVSAEQAEALGA